MTLAPLGLLAALAAPVTPVAPVPVQEPASLFWTEEAQLVSTAAAPGGSFGLKVAIWEDTILVGEPWGGVPANAGAVHVFVYDGASWNHEAQLGPSDSGTVLFGFAVALEGDTALIGTNTDQAYVFERSGTTWTELDVLRAPDASAGFVNNMFGNAVALQGNIAVVGAAQATNTSYLPDGAVYIFERGPTKWDYLTKFFPAVTVAVGQFGGSVAISGSTILGGSAFDGELGLLSGSARIFERTGATWTESALLLASDGQIRDFFGTEVALWGDTAVVTAPDDVLAPGVPGTGTGAEGSIHMFERNLGGPENWGHARKLTAVLPGTPTGYGRALALSGDRLLVGAPTGVGVGPLLVNELEGLAYDSNSGTLYGADTGLDQLLEINVATGLASTIGALGFDSVQGLAFDPSTNTLYGVDTSLDQLLSIDTGTGAATALGYIAFLDVVGLAFDPQSGTLYGADLNTDQLLSISTSTGAGTPIGPFAFPSSNQHVMGLAFDATSGTLFGVRTPMNPAKTDRLVTIDTATAATTVVGKTGEKGLVALAPAPASSLFAASDPSDALVVMDALTGSASGIGSFSTPALGKGAVFVYERNHGGPDAWGQVATISSPQAGPTDAYALSSIGIFGDTIVPGAHNTGGSQIGAAYVVRVADSATTYCTAGTSANGCQAALTATGSPSASESFGFHLAAASVEGQKNGIFFFGTGGRQANSWGNGTSFQCVTPPVKRAGLLVGSGTSGLCDGTFLQDLNALWCPTCPGFAKNPGAGATVQAQLWYRDPFNTSNQTTTLSDAVEFPVGP